MPRGRPRKMSLEEPVKSNVALLGEGQNNVNENQSGIEDQPTREMPELNPIAEKRKVKDDEYNLEVIIDFDGKLDPFYLPKKDPRYEYFFISTKPEIMSKRTSNLLLQGGGWQICDRKHCLRVGVPERLINADGHYQAGGCILAFMPKELYEEKIKFKQRKSDEQMGVIDRNLKQGIPNIGSPIHPTFKGIQTAKELRMNPGW